MNLRRPPFLRLL